MQLTMTPVQGDDPTFLALLAAGWAEIREADSRVLEEVPTFGANSDVVLVFHDGETPVAINCYNLTDDLTAFSRLTYVIPARRQEGVSRASWDLAHAYLAQIGAKAVARPVLASIEAGAAACEAYGFVPLVARHDASGDLVEYLMVKPL